MGICKELYVKIWDEARPWIFEAIDNGGGEIKLNREIFDEVGNQKKYAFRLDIENGIIPTKAGSAVARDLKKVLDECHIFKAKARGKNIVIRLGDGFELQVII